MNKSLMQCVAGVLVLAGWSGAQANVRLPAIIGENMVLQADRPLPVWGWADAGEDVTVTLGTAKESTKADDKGKWKVSLPALERSGLSAHPPAVHDEDVAVQVI